MKIGIEAQRIFRSKKHGMDMVILEVLRALQQMETPFEFVVFVQPDEDRCLQETESMKIVEFSGSYPVWEQIRLPKKAEQYGVDLLHCTSNTAPLNCSIPLVLTLHDIIYLEMNVMKAKGFTRYQRMGNLYRKWVVPQVLRKAKKVITVSNFEKERIGEALHLPKENLVAVYNAVSSMFEPITDEQLLANVKQLYQLPDQFIFFFGNTDPKKNTKRLIEAYIQYCKETDNPYPIVIGDYAPELVQQQLEKLKASNLFEQFYFPGYIIHKHMPAILTLAHALIYPSLRESFGIPILEGMACGTPVLTSQAASMPEVAGNAALLTNPTQVTDIKQGISHITSDIELRKKLIPKGLARAKEFSWEATAKQYLTIYTKTLDL